MAKASDNNALLTDVIQIEGRALVDLIDPVAIKQMRMAAPAVLRRAAGVIIRVVVDRHVDLGAIGNVAVVFLLQCITVIFEVIEDIERAMVRILDQTGANLITSQKGDELWMTVDFILFQLGPARDGNDAIV